ncbi:MAG TPA: halogenase, partial [Candidatus Luteimonas excrementigallinarum]|nr:halogenase [Candidatus Luteimonas excrementigallinarum]
QAGRALNEAMQPLLRAWGERNTAAGRDEGQARALDQFRIDWFRELNRGLGDKLDDAAFDARIHANVERMRWLAGEIMQRARSEHADLDTRALAALVGDTGGAPGSLEPHWYAAVA